ncbi:MAG: cardiolipin synthase [Clostridia bacterium]|nr:cardiolipin synthase [Clostridia bacterium]MBQ9785680.1 cardiolipin synthase [Clostridia bacterium]
MKKKIRYQKGRETVEREYNYIPVRYILAVMITLLEVGMVIGSVVLLSWLVPYFYIACWITQIVCVVSIIASDDNPDYKVPWLLFVMILPIAGFMLYFMFYSRTLQKKFVKRLDQLKARRYESDGALIGRLKKEEPRAAGQAQMLCDMADCALFQNTKQTYYPLGEDMHRALLEDLERAEKFIFMEYFIIEEGVFWNSILEILKKKAAAGVEVRVVWDDIGCMSTLPGNYAKILGSYGIAATPFSRLRGNADSEFNNRSHRKITVIDGRVGYTGGVNIADEYINERVRFGHWKDTAIRLEGDAVRELTRLFLVDYGINAKDLPDDRFDYFDTGAPAEASGYVIPFGDGPNPLYRRRVGKSVICNMLNNATRYVYMTTPYLILDNDTCQCIENAALRGVDVRIIVPYIPDKVIVYGMTQSYYQRLMRAGVRIYEYEPGFIHAKSYLADDEYAMIGTINLDYRSLVHHFENGVWMYRCDSIRDLKADIEDTLAKSVEVPAERRTNLLTRAFRAVVRIFAPML